VTEPVRAQERRKRGPAAYVAAQVLERLVRDDDVVGACAVRHEPQDLADVGGGAVEQHGAQLVVLGRAELGDRRVQVIRHPARERRRLRQEVARELLHR
jgi:hypothetical protein